MDILDLVVEREIGGYKWQKKILKPTTAWPHFIITTIVIIINVIIMACEPFCGPCVAP